MADIAKRFAENPILRPADIRPSIAGMKVECLLNPGVFRFDDKTWLLLRVAERPEQKPGKTSFPDFGREGRVADSGIRQLRSEAQSRRPPGHQLRRQGLS